MRILIDIGHPAHVHLFKNFAREMQKKGHKILFTARDKEHEIYLLEKYGFEYKSMGKHYKSKTAKIWGLLKFNIQLLVIALNFKPHIFFSHGSIYAAQVSRLLRRPHISLEDSGNMEQIIIYRPFTDVILTPDVLPEDLGPKQVRYKGYHELCYLHPNYFRADQKVHEFSGIAPGEKFCVLRFVSWDATHDKGHGGFTYAEKKKLVAGLSAHLKVYISSEKALEPEFSEYRLKSPPEKIHDVLAHAALFIGEGATMASEAGVLGTPSIYVNSIVRYYNEDQETYGLVYNFRNGNGVLEKALELLQKQAIKKEWRKRREKMLREKIDVTAFLVWFIENYPESLEIMRENLDYQERFK